MRSPLDYYQGEVDTAKLSLVDGPRRLIFHLVSIEQKVSKNPGKSCRGRRSGSAFRRSGPSFKKTVKNKLSSYQGNPHTLISDVRPQKKVTKM